ncbi:OLC1v1029956C1 [Oldenlandia corymbosa var. corymbosa]|uniref:OLC1v1029956C1 n=1 Tax=Oldenlandia corymbosa var. corymbosa TaxID=529605 RepID=A0AAV1CGS9_OLDCO|nr:OLC1v1029956C1 [Oldenlandia corymbosa var. corymbosa]
MMKKVSFNWKSWWWSLSKHNYLVLKLGVSALLLGLVFRFYLPRSDEFSEVSDFPFQDTVSLANAPSDSPPVYISSLVNDGDPIPSNGTQTSAVAPESSISREESAAKNGDIAPESSSSREDSDARNGEGEAENGGKCNLFNGDWVPHPAGPVYTNETCEWIEGHQNCMRNGRPDTGYLYWRWSPKGCELPQLNPEGFLELMRNKALALIGDSISRNHVQSIICILSKVEKAVQIYHDESYKSRKWLFPSYNFTVSVIWSPFLGEAAIFEDDNGVSSSEVELQLDKLDGAWTEQFKSLDYVMFSSGEWYVKSTIYYENKIVVGCHNCPKRNLTQLGFVYGYGKVLSSVFNYIIESNHSGMIFFRTITPDHFENGEWFNGGTCNRTEPAKEGEFERNILNKLLLDVELEEFKKASVKASERGINLRLFDINPVSLLRPDGHPGPYRFFHPFAKDKNAKVINDCLHWCLPGPIDSWNDLLVEMIVNG